MSSLIHRRIPRPSAALVVAFAALFTALSGTGYAALMITGANVANSSLTGADVKNESLGWKELKPNTLGGSRINESSLGTVPSAQHAATADNATNAQLAAKATDADTLGGNPASAFMLSKTRAYEANLGVVNNFANGSVVGTLSDVPPGTYVVTARLTYDNDGASATESCSLLVPGTDDTSTFAPGAGETETVSLQEYMSSAAVFSPTITCSSDGNDDTLGTGSIIAVRLD